MGVICLVRKDAFERLVRSDFVNLTYMKYHGGHTLDRHVYISNKEMEKMVLCYDKNSVTKFFDRSEAERCFKEVIDCCSFEISDWLYDTDKDYLILKVDHERPVGYGIQNKVGYQYDMTHTKSKLVRLDDSSSGVLGFYLQTMFPIWYIRKDVDYEGKNSVQYCS